MNTFATSNEFQKITNLLQTFINVEGRVARMLMRRSTALRLSGPNERECPAIAWTNGESITVHRERVLKYLTESFQSNDMEDVADRLAVMTAVIRHEMGHVLFTPSVGDPLIYQIRHMTSPGSMPMYYVWNLLEDQRIERLLLRRFPATQGYFTRLVLDFVVSTNEHAIPKCWPLLIERRYLPQKLRDKFRLAYVTVNGEANCRKLEKLVAEYCSLNLNYHKRYKKKDAQGRQEFIDRVCKIVHEVAKLIDRDTPTSVTEGNYESALKHDRQTKNTGEDATTGDGDEYSPDGDDWDTDGNGQGGFDTDGDNDDGESDSESGSGSAGDGAEGDDAIEGSDGSGPASESTDSSGDQAPGGSSDGSRGHGNTPRSIKNMAKRMLDRIYVDNPDYQDEVDSLMRDINDIMSSPDVDVRAMMRVDTSQCPKKEVPSTHIMYRENVYRELMQIKNDQGPSWNKRQTSGRLHTKHYMRAKASGIPPLDVWKRWSPGAYEDVKLQVSILLDWSGSMRHVLDSVLMNGWVLKSAFQKLNIPATVMMFGSTSKLLYEPHEKISEREFISTGTEGSTNPVDALHRSYMWFKKTRTTHPVLILLTDGDFDTTNGPMELIDLMNRMGTTTVFIGMGRHVQMRNATDLYKFKVVRQIDYPHELVEVTKSVVEQVMRSINRHH